MLKAYAQDGDIQLINDGLTWEGLGKWYAAALKQAEGELIVEEKD